MRKTKTLLVDDDIDFDELLEAKGFFVPQERATFVLLPRLAP